jgi:hypothetical protein
MEVESLLSIFLHRAETFPLKFELPIRIYLQRNEDRKDKDKHLHHSILI